MQAISISRAATLLPSVGPEGSNRTVRTIDDETIARIVRPRTLRKIDRFCRIGLTLMDALGATLDDIDRDRAGLMIGNDLGGWGYVEGQLQKLAATRQESSINPYVATAWFPAAVQGEISIAHNLRGYSKTFSAGALGAGMAIEHAVRRLLDGTLDMAMAGGIESPEAAIIVRALENEQRISDSHPASEAGCLIALQRVEDPGKTPVAVVSCPRRSANKAIDDIAAALAGEVPTDVYLPAVGAGDPRQAAVASLRDTALGRITGPVRCLDFAACGDVGSASFALALAAAAGLSQLTPPNPAPRALVLGTDFEGLFLAAAVRQAGGVA